MSRLVSLRDSDWILLGVLLVLAVLGVVQIYSATASTKFAGAHWKQIYWILLGLGLLVAASYYDYNRLLGYAPLLYVLTLGLLAILLVVGSEVGGARRWFRLGGLSFQVSEIAKLVMILLLARFFSESQMEETSLADLAKVALAVGIPMALIILQPDLGTALTMVPIALVTLFVAGLKRRYFVALLLAGVLALPVALHYMRPYQKERIATFLNPDRDPRNAGYQVTQSKIAVGSGQFWGKGVAQGTQTQLRFLPVPHTDFIFAAYAEEHGFFGVLLALLLYSVLLMRLLYNAQAAPDAAGMFLVVGTLGVMAFQVLVNVGMVVGYLPITGIPLPLMSYGGSSMVFTLAAMGLVNSVRIRRFVN